MDGNKVQQPTLFSYEKMGRSVLQTAIREDAEDLVDWDYVKTIIQIYFPPATANAAISKLAQGERIVVDFENKTITVRDHDYDEQKNIYMLNEMFAFPQLQERFSDPQELEELRMRFDL